jgi:hypothetical protein
MSAFRGKADMVGIRCMSAYDPKRTSNSRWREALLLLAVCCYGLCDYGVSPYMAFR